MAFTEWTSAEYQTSWHHRELCRLLDRMVSGECRRAMVFMPPRHGKSELVSRRLPAYILGRNPDASIISCSYGADLASRMNRDVQRIIDDEEYRKLFPGTELWGKNVRSNAAGSYLRNSDIFEVVGHKGVYRSTGIGGGITGMGFTFGIIDDPVKDHDQADSPVVRKAVWEWYTTTFYTRRATDARILLTMTRWHRDDLAGRLLALQKEDPNADRWEVLSLPAIRTENDPTAACDRRAIGEPLWPERFPLSDLAQTRANSARAWAALYQQNPQADGGTEWAADLFEGPGFWFDQWPTDHVARVIFLDPSKGKNAKTGDFSAFVQLVVGGDGVVYVDADMEQGRSVKRIVEDGVEMHRRFNAHAFGVEANGFQELLADEIERVSREQNLPIPIVPVENYVTSKETRIRRLGGYLGRREFRFKAGSKGARILVDQLKDFPHGEHDDGPDALEGAVRVAMSMLTGSDDGLGNTLRVA